MLQPLLSCVDISYIVAFILPLKEVLSQTFFSVSVCRMGRSRAGVIYLKSCVKLTAIVHLFCVLDLCVLHYSYAQCSGSVHRIVYVFPELKDPDEGL